MPVIDPLASYSFGVEISGITIAQFKEVGGLGITVGVIENRAQQLGGQPLLQKLPGSVHYDDIHLSRGKVADPAFWSWISTVQEGKIDQAFYVKCDDETNPSEVIEAGHLVCEIGLAVVKPAEFVVFRLAQLPTGTSAVNE